jgi:hypothetical protein
VREESAEWRVSYPHFTARSQNDAVLLEPSLEKINADIEKRVRLFTESATEAMECVAAGGTCDVFAFGPDPRWTLDYSVRSLQYRDVAVILVDGYENTLGNHPMDTSFSAAFDVRSGRAIVLGDVVDSGGLETLASVAVDAVVDAVGPDFVDREWINEGVRDIVNYSTWWPDDEGLHVVFAAYGVVPRAAGTPEIVLPWSVFDANDAATLRG